MKKITLYLLLVLLPFQSWCQLHEKFDDNRNEWFIKNGDAYSRKIESGKYILETFNEGHGQFTDMPCRFDPTRDFTMEISFVQIDGSDNNGIGLFWGKVNRMDKVYNEFVITTNGYYKIGAFGHSEWVKTDKVKPMGKTNQVRVVKKGTKMRYFLNDDELITNELVNYGFAAGFINYTKMRLEVDSFDFIQNLSPINLVEKLPHGLLKENLGPGVNSVADDLSPVISADGKAIYFGREKHENNTGGLDDPEDIWVSTFEGSQWGAARNMGSPVNDKEANNLSSVSADNNTLFFAGGDKFKLRKRTESGWSDFADVGIYYTNQSKNQESQLASDGKAMLFTVKNSKNIYFNADIDEKDIYVSTQDKSGRWSDPINLGSTINTMGDETSPFLASDGRTLYFSSNAHPGYGGSDIFMSKRVGDGWDKWTEPKNLGPEINSKGFDAYYVLPASGEYAYLVNDLNSIGKTDIFRIKLPKEVKPDAVVLLSGRALNAKNNKPVSAEILLDNLENGKEVAEANSDPSTGEFKIILQPGSNYGIHAAAKGYLSVNENIELASIHEYKEMQKDLLLVPIEVGLKLALNNVFFEQGKPTLRKESYPELDRLVQIMIDNPKMQIELGGYTDNVGNGTALMKLSQDRVNVVKKYLEDHSISDHRITGRGYGATAPREKNDTEEHRKMNRRVEFKILKN
jgi:outer membrane protein OmpA-like peptidoglycan-associated protein